MIFLMSGVAAAVMCLLPLWVLPVVCTIMGVFYLKTWKQSLQLAFIAALVVMVAATGLDFQHKGLMSKRIGGAIQMPWFLVPMLPGLLTLWVALFFSRLGATSREIFRSRSR